MADDPADPLAIFADWLADAEAHDGIPYAGAATLSTRDGGGVDGRIVRVHRAGDDGFLFGTDTRSAKARQLRRHGAAALTFYWPPLERQVRIRGRVEDGDDGDSDRTFDDRPRPSRITAWASQQSREIASRGHLERRFEDARNRFDDARPIPRPDTWRAYRLVPASLEFWSARRFRLHRRVRFEKLASGAWRRAVLQP